MRILYGLCSWGLGHATRSLPIIRALVGDGHRVTVYTCDRALAVVRRQMGTQCEYIRGVGYPVPYVRGQHGFVAKFTSFLPLIANAVRLEHRDVRRIVDERNIDIIVGDGKYGLFHDRVPSYFVAHQLRLIAPGRLTILELITEYFQYRFHKKFRRYIVPDYEHNSLSGNLSHNLRLFDDNQIVYIGILSEFRKEDLPLDIDYFISVSGPEPSRTTFEKQVLAQVNNLGGRVIAALGKPEKSEVVRRENVEIHSYVDGKEGSRFMNRAKLVISRSGYSTLMDLAELGKKALLIPTPGQTEQEYLARYHQERGAFCCVPQRTMDLKRDTELAAQYPGVTYPQGTSYSVKKFMETIFG